MNDRVIVMEALDRLYGSASEQAEHGIKGEIRHPNATLDSVKYMMGMVDGIALFYSSLKIELEQIWEED